MPSLQGLHTIRRNGLKRQGKLLTVMDTTLTRHVMGHPGCDIMAHIKVHFLPALRTGEHQKIPHDT